MNQKPLTTQEMVNMINKLSIELKEVKEQKQNFELFGLPETKLTIARDFLAIIGVGAIIFWISSLL